MIGVWVEDRIFENDNRQGIMDELQSEPGLTHSDLRDRTGLGDGTVRHHLVYLARAGKVVSRKINHRRRYYPKVMRNE